jgi:hypothetical protein
MKWVILHVTARTVPEVVALDHVVVVVAVAAALTCVATTVTRWATSRATVQLWRSSHDLALAGIQ